MDDLERRARAAIDEAHAGDPEQIEGRPAEAVYADLVEGWVLRLVAVPSLGLRLAARAQHLERWAIPRADFPAGRSGYLRWRSSVHQRQGQRVRQLLAEAGCEAPVVERVARLVAKATSKDDTEAQALEDAACLVFLETELAAFALAHSQEKVVDVLQKTWRRMGPRGRELALGLALPSKAEELLRTALA